MEQALTNFSQWEHVASASPKESWRERSELAAFFIRPGDRVCDLGAGAQPLKHFLPCNTSYLPVDCVGTLPGTHVADFNKPDFTLPSEPFDVITALGVFNYIEDLDAFMKRLSEQNEGKFVIFTYDFWKMTQWFRNDGNLNGIGELEQGVELFSKYVRDLKTVAVLRRRAMFTGTLGQNETSSKVVDSATKIICRRVRPLEYLAIKLFRVHMMPRWLA